MNTPFYSATEFIDHQIEEVLESYERWLEKKEKK